MQATDVNFLRYIPLLPLIGAVFNGLVPLFRGKKHSREMASWVACGVSAIAFVLSLYIFFRLTHFSPDKRLFQDIMGTWISSGNLKIHFAFRVDVLSSVMMMLVTGICTIIQIYSVGYMSEDPGYSRYFSYIGLFVSAMLLLVMADNLVLMFMGWEGVSLVTYLLVGFWFTNAEKARAGATSFIVNRIGDLGFLIGIFLLFAYMAPETGTFSFSFRDLAVLFTPEKLVELTRPVFLGFSLLEWVGLFFFLGIAGKSAQLPFYIWLPTASAGPTPVVAMIHAGTIAIAGVYAVARLHFLYAHAPVASLTIASVGACTALFAAIIAMFQYELKNLLTFATISQLGFMFVGVGVGAYSAGVFHMMSHAFFMSLLVLGAGSIIVGMNYEQDIRKMGGLNRSMKITYFTFLFGTLAIVGFPGFSGFFSRGNVLWMALAKGHPFIWFLSFLASIVTAFYMTRLLCLVFLGEFRADRKITAYLPEGEPTESPNLMTVPLICLAVLALVGGWLGISDLLGGYIGTKNYFYNWMSGLFGKTAFEGSTILFSENVSMSLSVMGLMVGAGAALFFYFTDGEKALKMEAELLQAETPGFKGQMFRLVFHKFYIEELYHAIVVKPVYLLSKQGLWVFDVLVVDGLTKLPGRVIHLFTRGVTLLQNGNVKVYLYGMAIGLVSLLTWLTITSSPF